MVATAPETMSPPDRGIRWFLANQTSWSRAVLGSGIAVLTFYIIGAIAVLTSHGWTGPCPEGVTRLECSPSDPLAEGLKSAGLGLVGEEAGIDPAFLHRQAGHGPADDVLPAHRCLEQ